MRSVTGAGTSTVRLACAEAPLRPSKANRSAPAASSVSTAPAIAPPLPTPRVIHQPIDPLCNIIRAGWLTGNLVAAPRSAAGMVNPLKGASVAAATPRCYSAFDLRRPLEDSGRGRCEGPRFHEVEARMTPQNALHPLFDESAFPAHRRGMAHRAEALFSHPATPVRLYVG